MTLYDLASTRPPDLHAAMIGAGAYLAPSDWIVVRAIKAARAEFNLTRDWPVTVWIRNGPGEHDPFESIARVGDVVFDLSETPETRDMTDEQIRLFTIREVRRQIREALRLAGAVR